MDHRGADHRGTDHGGDYREVSLYIMSDLSNRGL